MNMQIHYLERPCSDYVRTAVQTASDIHREDAPGDILIFLTGATPLYGFIRNHHELCNSTEPLRCSCLCTNFLLEVVLQVMSCCRRTLRAKCLASRYTSLCYAYKGLHMLGFEAGSQRAAGVQGYSGTAVDNATVCKDYWIT